MAYKRQSPIPIIEGGTNAQSMATTDGVVYYDGTRLVTTSTGTAGQVLTSNGAAAPTYQNSSGGTGVGVSVIGTANANATVGPTNWIAPFGAFSTPTQSLAQYACPTSGVLKNLYVNCENNPSTIDFTVTLNVNSGNTALTTTIPALTTGEFTDLTHSVSVAQGDLLQFEITTAATNQTTFTIGAEFIATGTPASSGLVLLQTQTAAGVANLDFTGLITPTYNNYLLLIDSFDCPTAASDTVIAQISTDGGATYINTGYDISTSSGLNLGSASAFASTTFGGYSNNLNNLTSGSGYITNSGTFSYYNTANGAVTPNLAGGAYGTAATVVNALRVTIVSGKVWSGTATLYGYTK